MDVEQTSYPPVEDLPEEDEQDFVPEVLRSYKYEERRNLAVAQSFASPCKSDSECTNKCCKNVVTNQKYSYYKSDAIYAGYYATSYGVYTYRYSSYYPYYKVT